MLMTSYVPGVLSSFVLLVSYLRTRQQIQGPKIYPCFILSFLILKLLYSGFQSTWS